MTAAERRATWRIWGLLMRSQLREQPARLLVTVLTIALGVSLGAAVYLVNTAALNEFGAATKKLVGEADIIVRGTREGFPESLYSTLANAPEVRVASPVLEVDAALPGRRETLKILGLDPFVAASLQPPLIAELADHLFESFGPDTVFLSSTAAEQLQVREGGTLSITVGSRLRTLRVLGVLTPAVYPQALGIMDIASAQLSLGALGKLNRIDLRVADGVDVDTYRRKLAAQLPAGVVAVAPEVERDRAVTVTRAYRVNLNMLALVALWTGAFLVFSTQSLSVMRRLRGIAVLRALGMTKRQVQLALLGEGLFLGAVGALFGIFGGIAAADALLHLLTGDLGNGQLRTVHSVLGLHALPLLVFFAIGTAVASVGAWFPARAASRRPPAQSLKGGDVMTSSATRRASLSGLALLCTGALLARAPAWHGLPVLGYIAIAALLIGAVLLVPTLTVRILRAIPRTGSVLWNTAVAQLRENVGLSTLSLASIIVSFSLMVAMAIMVYSFRVSFDHWLGKLLPADIQVRVPVGNDTAFWPPAVQSRLAAVAGIARIEFRRTRSLLLDPARPPVTLIARDIDVARAADILPLTQHIEVPTSEPPVWVSEALQDLYKLRLGQRLDLPLGGSMQSFRIAGVWRDYARTFGALVISRATYSAATTDADATEASAWLSGNRSPQDVEAELRATFERPDLVEIMTSAAVRERSLQIFDRAFLITYAIEAVAVFIGLAGISFAASSTALARRAEFGMLRHIGMLRRQVVGLLATEGLLMSAFGVLYGLLLGGVLSLVLIYVVNRQSFNWSIDLAVPYWQLALLGLALIGAAAVTAIWSGRATLATDALRAVREDW